MTSEQKRDVLDVSTPNIPEENKPVTADRPTVSPQEGAYFLDKFLEKKAEPAEDEVPAEAKAAPATADELQANIVDALREIFDPEIPVNIYDMGLIYAVNVAEDFSVQVVMTLTTPHCPVAETMPGEVEMKTSSVAGVNGVTVDLVWDPPWDMSCMSDEARLELGLL